MNNTLWQDGDETIELTLARTLLADSLRPRQLTSAHNPEQTRA